MKYIEIKSDNGVLRGMYHKSEKRPCRPAIIVHGYFSATRMGPQRLFVYLSNSLCQRGFDVYRFDLSGMGESDGDIRKITFHNHVTDVNNIISFVQSRNKGERISVISHSIGCGVSLECVSNSPSNIDKLIMIAPAFTCPPFISSLFNSESYSELVQNNYTYRRGLFVHSSFLDDNSEEKFKNLMDNITVPINVIIAECDQLIPMERSHSMFDGRKNVRIVDVPFADHNFLEQRSNVVSLVVRMMCNEQSTI